MGPKAHQIRKFQSPTSLQSILTFEGTKNSDNVEMKGYKAHYPLFKLLDNYENYVGKCYSLLAQYLSTSTYSIHIPLWA